MRVWRTLSRRVILNHSRFLSVESHAVELPDGRVIEDWPWLVTPDYVNVLARLEDGHFLLFRQVKYALDAVSLAPVGGYIEPGEAPLAAAQRELLEETGCQSDDWVPLGQYAVDGNRGAGVAHLFLARGARRMTSASADDLEEQAEVLLSRAEVEAALAAREFKMLSWAAVVALALPHCHP